MEKNKIKIVVGAMVLILVILVGAKLFIFNKAGQKEQKTEVLPTEVLIPTVDSSVKVDLKSATAGRDVTLSIEGIPSGTKSMEYSLSYNTVKQGIQGVIGTVSSTDIKGKSYSKDLTLGTCSSGTCVYHEVDGPISLSLKFSGSFGEKIFEKDFNL